jgi:hypothetical protein
MREQENRGIKDPERFKLQQVRKEELERRQEEAEKKYTGDRGGELKVIVRKSRFWSVKIRLNYSICSQLPLHFLTCFPSYMSA